ncbi:MAG: primosomal protein N' [Deltaproteobacteria bacterium]|nr:primosomal protein N' [Deltaproteobacteria bacterium]
MSAPFSSLSYALPPYFPQDAWAEGQRVAAPLGKGLRSGVILELARAPAADGSAGLEQKEDFVLRDLLWPLEREPLLSADFLDLVRQLARRQGFAPGRVLAAFLPSGLRAANPRLRFFTADGPRLVSLRCLAALPLEEQTALAGLWSMGRAEIPPAGQSPLDADLCLLRADPPWRVRPAAVAQLALLEYLLERGQASRRQLLKALGGKSAAVLATLVKRGLVEILPAVPEEEQTAAGPIEPGKAFVLTPGQREVFTPLRQALGAGLAQTRLLFGITGSGKTAIYLELARETLAMGRSVMLLAPEVALALKLWNDASATLPGVSRHLFHGYLGSAARERIFRSLARSKEPTLVVGARSALFLPLANVGLFILDEEHDSSFKQDEGFPYQAKEVAWYRAGQEKALLLLGSATPDIKTFHAAREGKIPLHRLSERVGAAAVPETIFLPLPRSGRGLLVPESAAALSGAAARGEQTVIVLNRRGYAPLMYCLSCGTAARCPHCDIALTYHKAQERLLCHYCGHSAPFPSPCSACGDLRFLPLGLGTEKLEEDLAALLPPGAGVLRLDRDSSRRPGRLEEILAAFARQEAAVLVGTQMLSKGHHFPEVTLVIVADADLGLNLPDYRAAERTFQLLVQSAGRSGRGDKQGKVIIQTRDPSHYCWQFVRSSDYEGFFSHELALRKLRNYPPFVRLALLRISFSADRPGEAENLAALAAALRPQAASLGITLLGPAPAPLPLLKGRRRFHCLLKGQDWNAMRALKTAAQKAARHTRLRLDLDLDPLNML